MAVVASGMATGAPAICGVRSSAKLTSVIINLAAIGIAIAVIDLLVHHSGFKSFQEYAAIALGILAYFVAKAVIALAVT